jgi:hypothetical protein
MNQRRAYSGFLAFHIRSGTTIAAARLMATKQAQALAIRLSRERREGKNVPPPPKGRYSEKTRKRAKHDLEEGRKRTRRKKGS